MPTVLKFILANIPPQRLVKFRARFISKLTHNDGCIEFSGAKRTDYGRISLCGQRLGAHRVAWVLAGRDLPSWPLQLDHLCRNRACVNVEHLRIATPRENILSGVGCTASNAKKTACPKGHTYTAAASRPQRRCRACESWSAKKRHAANPQKKRDMGAKYRASNQEKVKERHRLYRAANLDRERQRSKLYYLAHRDEILTKQSARYKVKENA